MQTIFFLCFFYKRSLHHFPFTLYLCIWYGYLGYAYMKADQVQPCFKKMYNVERLYVEQF